MDMEYHGAQTSLGTSDVELKTYPPENGERETEGPTLCKTDECDPSEEQLVSYEDEQCDANTDVTPSVGKENILEQDTFLENSSPHNHSVLSLRLSERQRKVRCLNTTALYSAYLLFGFFVSPLGPSLIDLKQLLQTDTKSIVLLFPIRGIGSIIGCLVIGLLLGKLNYNIVMLTYSVFAMLVLASLPWMPNLFVFIAVSCFHGFAAAGLHTAGQVYLLLMWLGTKRCHVLMQAMHALFSLAATIVPFVLEPFLSKRIHVDSNCTTIENGTRNDTGSYTYLPKDSINATYQFNCDNASEIRLYTDTRVQYGFLTISCICIVSPILSAVAFIYEGSGTVFLQQATHQNKDQKPKAKTQCKRILVLFVVCAYFALYVSSEHTMSNLIATFVVDGLQWERWKGPMITSVFYGSFGLARFVSIFLAHYVSPKRMIAFDIIIIDVSLVVMIFAASVPESVIWVCVALIGGAKGPLYGAGMVLVGKVIQVDGHVSAAISFGNALAIMAAIALVGNIFEEFGAMYMVCYLIGNNLLFLATFIVLLILMSRRVNQRPQIPSTGDLDEKVVL